MEQSVGGELLWALRLYGCALTPMGLHIDLLLSSLVTYGTLIYRRRIAPGSLKLMLLLAPFAIGISVLSSLYNSWMYDVQPQGRYLFSALAPLAVLMGGTIDIEPPLISKLRAYVWIALFVLSLFLLWYFVLRNPQFH
jgi:hypothetical protein